MILRDLLDEPSLRLRVLHGNDAALDRPVRWTYSSDLMDPGRYLVGGEVVITGLVWRRSEADSETFVSNIHAAGALALVAGEAQFGCVPGDVVDACRRHDLVLLSVPESVSFGALSEHIIGSAANERGTRLENTLSRHRQLLSSLARGERLEDLVDRVGREAEVTCRVLTATGRHMVAAGERLADADIDRITGAFLTADRFPAVVRREGHPTYSLFPVGPALGSRLTMWMLVVTGDVALWPTPVSDGLAELAAITQLERSRIEEGRRMLRPIADDAIRLVAAGAAGQPETLVRLRQAGFDPESPLAVVVAGFVPADSVPDERAIVDEAISHLEGAIVAQAPDGSTVALVPGSQQAWATRLRTALLRLGPGLVRTRLAIGLSDAAPLSGLVGMWDEARHAQGLAARGKEAVSIVEGREITSHVLLLATVPDDIRRTFVNRVLGPVLEYDAEHNAGLLATLESFLECSGSWNRAAQAMHLHVNTVRYRIGRVEDLTGRDMSRLEDRVDVFLALRSIGALS